MKTNDINDIILKGVKVNNLKNIDIRIPHEKFTVITGVSGSGKTSLAFDTLYAEGQRRYVESLSSYARQFMGRLNKPDVDFIEGIPPAIAIKQTTLSKNPRSTVGTTTEIYDYLKLLYAKIGKTISPISGKEIKKHSVDDVVNFIVELKENTKVIICFTYTFNNDKSVSEQLDILKRQGYNRVLTDEDIIKLDDFKPNKKNKNTCRILIDRIKARNDNEIKSRLRDSVQTAFFEGKGECCIFYYPENSKKSVYKNFSNKFEADGIIFETPTEHLFSFNNPLGACPVCEGYGKILGIDEDLVVPNKGLSIYDEAVVCWKGEKMKQWLKYFISNAVKYDFPIHRPYFELNEEQLNLLWYGNRDVSGIYDFFEYIEKKKHKIQYRIMLSRYRGKTTCPECKGKRLKKEAYYVKVDNKSIGDLIDIPVNRLLDFFENIKLSQHDKEVSNRIVKEIITRLQSVIDVGLSYLTLNRLSSTLSGGESQRIRIASIFGAGLTGSLYILDEPSIGLHGRDTQKLIKIIKNLRDKNNTVVVVEHDEEIIKAADYIIDIGPEAGTKGGEVIYQGSLDNMIKNSDSITAKYLRKELTNTISNENTNWRKYIEIKGARHNNLKNIDVKIPLDVITVITGVSGSGKTSLVKGILYPAFKKAIGESSDKCGEHSSISGDINFIKNIEYINQNPIGKSSRSNPATYIKAYDEIRKLFADQEYAKSNNYKASFFSFNVDGGRCEVCLGEGEIKVEMQFMADVYLKCDACNGKRFKEDILDVKYKGNNIYDILEMTIEEAVDFFKKSDSSYTKKIVRLLNNYIDVGLNYLKLGQSSNTLSGGESQRIKLASFLSVEKSEPILFVFDEPTVGLHFHDISKLLKSFKKIKDKGHSIIIIEHNPDIIKFADWIIDLGPEGGEYGGQIVCEGKISEIKKCKNSYTAKLILNSA